MRGRDLYERGELAFLIRHRRMLRRRIQDWIERVHTGIELMIYQEWMRRLDAEIQELRNAGRTKRRRPCGG